MKANRLRQLPAGVKDYLFDEARRRRAVERQIVETLGQSGYREIITPTVEYLEVFATAGRNGLNEKIYRFLDRDGNLIALRSDFTAQVARIVASKSPALEFPLRLLYSGKIFRFEELHAGRSRETWQVGFELLGNTGIEGEVEVLKCVLRALQSLHPSAFQITLGTIEFFNGIVEEAGLQGEQLAEIKHLIGHKDVDTLVHTLERTHVATAVQSALRHLVELHGNEETLSRALALATNLRSQQAVENLKTLHQRLREQHLDENVTIDLSEVHGMGYYSGIMIKAYVRGVGYEVGSGGRYDNLLSQFGFDCPAVGFSFDVDRLVEGVS